MKNKPWKKWKTRKTTLIFAIVCVCIYSVISIIMVCCNKTPDGTLTEQIFSFFKWLVVTGCAITITSSASRKKAESDFDDEAEG